MTSAYILITAILLLGGLIAVLGDLLGSKVGKARLRLFNLRPRRTAMVITILTGTTISLLSLGILFSLSKSLRRGVFELDEIEKRRRRLEYGLAEVTQQKNQVEQELEDAKVQQAEVEQRLEQIKQNFQQAQTQLKTTSQQANALRADVSSLLAERQKLSKQRAQLKKQISQLQEQIKKRDRELASQDQKILAQDQIIKDKEKSLLQLEQQQSGLQAAIAQRDADLQKREIQLKQLEGRLVFLQQEVEVLEQYYQNYLGLREKKIALLRGEVLAFATIRMVDRNKAISAVDVLLQQANRKAIEATIPANGKANKQTIKITKAEVQQLIQKIQDGREYLVRILSSGNYVEGEKQIRVFADVVLNREIFKSGQTIAKISLNGESISQQELQQRLDLLLAASRFRARRAGILGGIQVEDISSVAMFNFLLELSKSEERPEQIKAVALETTHTAGPLKLRLVAIRNGEVLFST